MSGLFIEPLCAVRQAKYTFPKGLRPIPWDYTGGRTIRNVKLWFFSQKLFNWKCPTRIPDPGSRMRDFRVALKKSMCQNDRSRREASNGGLESFWDAQGVEIEAYLILRL